MKTQKYIRLSLLAPYIAWIILASSVYMFSYLFTDTQSPPMLDTIMMPVIYYVFGILIWGIPYSLLAITLGIWSRNQEPQKTAKVFAVTPLILATLVTAQAAILFLFDGGLLSTDFGSMVLMLSILSIIYGYIIIGFVAGTYKLLSRVGFIHIEEEHPTTAAA